jgi:hypothetical protein
LHQPALLYQCEHLTLNPGVRVQALTHLDLSNNELGTQAISNLLSDKNHVQHLCLSKCGIGSSAAATILRCWTNATGERVLQRLHFADNALGDACWFSSPWQQSSGTLGPVWVPAWQRHWPQACKRVSGDFANSGRQGPHTPPQGMLIPATMVC